MHTPKRLITALILVFSLCLCMASFALADSTGTITDDCVRIRTKPSTDSEIYQQLNNGDTVTVTKGANEDGWVEIKFTYAEDGTIKTGYVSQDFISVDESADSSEESKDTFEKKSDEKTEAAQAEEDAAKADEEASQSAEAEASDEAEASSAVADAELSTSISLTATVANTEAQIFKEADADADVVIGIEEGCIVSVLGDEDENGWIEVSYIAGDGVNYQGYMTSDVLDLNAIGKGSCNIASAILRQSPDATSEMVGILPLNADVDIFESRDGMYRVEYQELAGWVDTSSISIECANDCYGYGIVTVDDLRLRSKRSTDSSVKAKMPEGTVLQLISLKNGWYKTVYNGYTGYVMADYMEETDPTFEGYIQVTASSLYLRAGAGTDFAKLATIPSGKVLKTTGAVGAWYEVTYGDFTGFVSGDFVSATTKDGFTVSQETTADDSIVVTADALNLRAEPDETSQKLDSLPFGTELDILGEVDGWYQVEYNGQVGYVKAEFTGTAAEAVKAVEAAAAAAVNSNSSALSYATQFVGNPYVWGGTSLTNGCDCSGFVKAIFAQYGVSLPHSSAAIRGYGKEVSYSDMQPGDVVCYSGHVGIYAGNGQLLSALNKKKGITYCSVNYKKILTIRRML